MRSINVALYIPNKYARYEEKIVTALKTAIQKVLGLRYPLATLPEINITTNYYSQESVRTYSELYHRTIGREGKTLNVVVSQERLREFERPVDGIGIEARGIAAYVPTHVPGHDIAALFAHELSHVFGLPDCRSNRCIMNPHANIEEIGSWGIRHDFCENCRSFVRHDGCQVFLNVYSYFVRQ